MFLVPLNILTFYFSVFKIFLQILVLIKFSIITFGSYFCIFLIVQKCVEYCKKNYYFFNKT